MIPYASFGARQGPIEAAILRQVKNLPFTTVAKVTKFKGFAGMRHSVKIFHKTDITELDEDQCYSLKMPND